ncbi:insulinase family protein [Alicyclobacillus sp. TC]|uniref:EF-P 5-aminopentanol modification-associated protein YfmF n=1 Tax=Alicyclobacillus sp. TC TaxID=2606450 RepID=UPI001933F10F|nr:insulinase family protein [Alicyclobacillus sp. TC]QRF23968.1 insulinase family protein [Alicyclobacillus sp. TC]
MPTVQHFGDKRLRMHALHTEKFYTRHYSIKLTIPLDAKFITSTAVLPYLWLEGSKSYPSARKIMQLTDSLYGTVLHSSVSKRGGLQVVEISAAMPYIHGNQENRAAMNQLEKLLMELLMAPATNEDGSFLSTHVSKVIELQKNRIRNLHDDKTTYAFEQAMERASRPLPASLPRLGYLDELENDMAPLLYTAYRRLLENAKIDIYVSGKLYQVEDMWIDFQQKLESQLSMTNFLNPLVEPIQKSHMENRAELRDIEYQRVNQAKLNLVYCSGIGYAHPLYPAALVMNGILGKFPHSKLFVEVREKRSLAYYASSQYDSMTGFVVLYAGVQPGKVGEARLVMEEQVEAIQKGKISEQEIQFTKSGLLNQYKQLEDQPASWTEIDFNGQLTGQKLTMEDLQKKISDVTVEDIKKVAEHLTFQQEFLLTARREQV